MVSRLVSLSHFCLCYPSSDGTATLLNRPAEERRGKRESRGVEEEAWGRTEACALLRLHPPGDASCCRSDFKHVSVLLW